MPLGKAIFISMCKFLSTSGSVNLCHSLFSLLFVLSFHFLLLSLKYLIIFCFLFLAILYILLTPTFLFPFFRQFEHFYSTTNPFITHSSIHPPTSPPIHPFVYLFIFLYMFCQINCEPQEDYTSLSLAVIILICIFLSFSLSLPLLLHLRLSVCVRLYVCLPKWPFM